MSIKSIRERAEAATPGPWVSVPDEDDFDDVGLEDGTFLFLGVGPVEDSRFIAHARTDIPALLRVAEAASKARDGLGSVMWVANNAHNHKLDDFRLLLESALEDWRKGYDALSEALAALEALP